MLERLTVGLVLVAATAAGCGSAPERSAPAADGRATLLGAGRSGGAPTLRPSLVEAMQLDAARASRVATFRVDGGERSLYIAPTQKGETCVVEVGLAQHGAGCSPKLFGDHAVAFVEASNGGPEAATLTELHVAGLAAANVGSIAIELARGRVGVPLTPRHVFLYEAAVSDLRAGVLPSAIVAFDRDGKEIERVELPAPLRPR